MHALALSVFKNLQQLLCFQGTEGDRHKWSCDEPHGIGLSPGLALVMLSAVAAITHLDWVHDSARGHSMDCADSSACAHKAGVRIVWLQSTSPQEDEGGT